MAVQVPPISQDGIVERYSTVRPSFKAKTPTPAFLTFPKTIQALLTTLFIVQVVNGQTTPSPKVDLVRKTAILPSVSNSLNDNRKIIVTPEEFLVRLSDEIETESPTLLLGTLPCNSTTTISLPIRNELSESIAFERLETSCGCIAAVEGKKALSPGESSFVTFQVTTASYEMELKKSLQVFFALKDSGKSRNLGIRLDGESKPIISFARTYLDLRQRIKNGDDGAEVEVFINSNFTDIKLSEFEISSSSEFVKIGKLNLMGFQPKLTLNLTRLTNVPFDEWTESITFKHKEFGNLVLPMKIYLKGSIKVRPEKVSLANAQQKEGVRIMVSGPKSEELKLESSKLYFDGAEQIGMHLLREVVSRKDLAIYSLTVSELPNLGRTPDRLRVDLKFENHLMPVTVFFTTEEE